MSGVSAVALARWQDVQAGMRELALQRGLRFVAVAVLAPFGVTALDKDTPGRAARILALVSGPGFSTALYALMGGAFLAGGLLG